MIYPIYVDRWFATPAVTAALFSTYPIALVGALIVLGSLSDAIGRRGALLAGLSVVAAGSLVFVVADAIGALFLGRALQGLGVGVALSAAAAALVEFDRSGRPERVGTVNTIATSSGAVTAIVVGGAFVEFAQDPEAGPFALLVALVLALMVAVRFLPRGSPSSAGLHPAWPAVPARSRRTFLIGVLTVSGAFAVGGVVLALGAQVARDVVGSDSALLTSIALAAWPAAGVPAAILARHLGRRRAALLGGAVAAIGSLLLLPAGTERSLLWFLAASVSSGAGYGLLFTSGFASVSAVATPPGRAGDFATMYLAAYTTQAGSAVAAGVLATTMGLQDAIALVAPALAVLSLCAAASNGRRDARGP